MFNNLNLVMLVAFTPLAVLLILAVRDQVLGWFKPSSRLQAPRREILALWATAGHRQIR